LVKVPDDTGGLKILSRAAGAPAIDLAQVTLSLQVLDVVPEDLARRRQILPLRVDDDRLFVAALAPEDRVTLDELAFLTGRRVVAYAAHPDRLRATIAAAYDARRRGAETWTGPRATHDEAALEAAIRRDAVAPPPPVREPFGADAPYKSSTPPLGSARPCVLVVDDEPVIRRLQREALAQRGYEVIEADGGNAAFREVKRRDPDVILLDAMLPDVHGFDVCKRLKSSQRYRHIPIVMVTAVYKGWRMAADLVESYGVAAVVEKPFDLHHLVRVVERALSGGAPERPSAEEMRGEAQRLYREGAAAYRAGDLEAAAAALTAAVAIDPLSPSLRHQLGLVHARRGLDYAAIQELEAAIDLEPERYATLRNLAVLYQKHGFRRKACEAWERAIPLAADDATRAEVRKVLLALIQGG
jgi:DNA-binding response OmpR family regulator